MPRPWLRREIAVTVPMTVARDLWRRAEQFDLSRHGRLDVRSAVLLVWTAPEAVDSSEPMGAAYIRWHTPDDGHAQFWLVEWDPTVGGTEDEIWRALDVLAGQPIPR